MLGATALFLPAPGPPACTLRARLNLKAASNLLQKQGTLGREPISLFLCRPLLGSPEVASWRAAPASGSQLDSDIVRATNSHLNVDTRGRAPEVDLLYLTSWGCLVVDKYKDCSVMVEAVVHLNTDRINNILAILRSRDQQLLKSIEIETV
jgi:hypothetical protein